MGLCSGVVPGKHTSFGYEKLRKVLEVTIVKKYLKTSLSANSNNSNQTKFDRINAHVYCSAPVWRERHGWKRERETEEGGPHKIQRPPVLFLGGSLNSLWEWS